MKTELLNSLGISFDLAENTILLAYRGSITHGTYIPNTDPLSIDDKDIMGVCIPPMSYYLGLDHFDQVEKFIEPYDIVVYEFKKAMKLLRQCNPNILSLLWLEPQYYLKIQDPAGKLLLENREIFVAKEAYGRFVGYARGQLHRMTHFRYEGYMGTKRKQLVDQFGYDVKNASHLIRLLRMGIEFLTTGKLQVLRTQDATELIEIKRGEWSLEKVQIEAQRLFQLADEAYIHSPLPDKVDYQKVNELTQRILNCWLIPCV